MNLWEADAWHGYVGGQGEDVVCLMVVGPTRRAPADQLDAAVVGAEFPLRYVRSWSYDPDEDERDAVLDRYGLELERAREQQA